MPLVLVLNAGSSSVKWQLIDVEKPTADGSPATLAKGAVERVGEGGPSDPVDHAAAVDACVQAAARHLPPGRRIEAVGHRVVHGGVKFVRPTVVTDEVLHRLAALRPLAPLHVPVAVASLEGARAALPEVPHVAVFDTAFHAGMPDHSRRYALPLELTDKLDLYRYGFHGINVAHVTCEAAHALGVRVDDVDLVVCHIGNGVSMTAVAGGRSVDTTMGFSPVEGLVMGSRSGSVDPTVVLHLQRAGGLGVDDVEELLNRGSGLRGMAGHTDLRDVRAAAERGDEAAVLALDLYTYRLRTGLGAMLAAVPTAQAIVFTGGAGEHDARLRADVCEPLRPLGVRLDRAANAALADDGAAAGRTAFVSEPDAPLRLLVIPAGEEGQIAVEVAAVLDQTTKETS
ncbi:MAG: acetate/propionate family kinase [Actinomycetales bacterium]